MKKSRTMLAMAVVALCGAASAQNLRPGLWEVTQTPQGDSQMSKEMAQMQKELAAMSPAERKQMEAMMGTQGMKMGTAGGGISLQFCMTAEMAERNEPPAQQGDCTTTRQSRSGNTTKLSFTCTQPPSSGEGQYTVVSPESYKSVMTITSGKDKTTLEGAGKWLKKDCGSVKPLASPKR